MHLKKPTQQYFQKSIPSYLNRIFFYIEFPGENRGQTRMALVSRYDIYMSDRNFPDIYGEFYPKITHYLARIVGDNEAEDVAQVVFEKVSNKF